MDIEKRLHKMLVIRNGGFADRAYTAEEKLIKITDEIMQALAALQAEPPQETSKVIGTCGHELSEEWCLSSRGNINIKDRTREGEKCVSLLVVCENCLKIHEPDILKTKAEVDEWLACQKSQGELVEKNRARIARDMIMVNSGDCHRIAYRVIAEEALKHLGQACDRIEQLEAYCGIPTYKADGVYGVGQELGKRAKQIKDLEAANADLKKDKANLEEIESDLNNTIGFLQTGIDNWKKTADDLRQKLDQIYDGTYEKEIEKMNEAIRFLLKRTAGGQKELRRILGADRLKQIVEKSNAKRD